MTDRDALLAAIISQPDEDTPRLMLADWLQENGQPERGQFVRFQVEAAHAEPFSPQAREYEHQAHALLERHGAEWARHLAERTVGRRFARGFVEHVAVNAATFARDAAALFAAEPVRSVQVVRFAFTTSPVPLDAVFGVPELARVTKLDLSQLRNHPDFFDQLSACPRLAGLTDLNLRNSPVPVAWLRTFLTGTAMPALAGLDLAENVHLSRVLAEALPAADHRRLARLDLSFVVFSSDHLQKVLAARCVRDLQELRLAWRDGSGPGPLTHLDLGWSLPWGRLRLLDLDGQGLGNEGVREVVTETARRRGPSPLRWLGLRNNGLGADAVRLLVGSDPARLNLYYLDLRENRLTAAHRAALRDRFPDAEVLV